MTTTQTAHQFAFVSLDGSPLPLSGFSGKAVLLANTASGCGFTPQYAGLQQLAATYRQRGLVVVGVPSNDFGGQEPLDEAGIGAFCTTRFGVDFPVAAKTATRGADAHPFFRWIRQRQGFFAGPHWNFYKYLIAPDGRLVDWFSPLTKPGSPRLVRAIETVLPR